MLGNTLANTEASDKILNMTMGRTSEGYQGNMIGQLLFKLDKLLGGQLTGLSSSFDNRKVLIEMNDRRLKESRQPNRSASYGP